MLFRRVRHRHRINQGFGAAPSKRSIVVLVVLALIFVFIIIGTARMRPILMDMAKYQTERQVAEIINKTILDSVSSGDFDYSKLVTLERDDICKCKNRDGDS